MSKMKYSTKLHLLLVAFFLLCFISPCAQAGRSLKEVVSAEKKHDEVVVVETTKEEHSSKLDNLEGPSKGTHLPDADELTGMDYTPARRKPPIHN